MNTRLAQIYLQVIENRLGLPARVDDDGDVAFRFQDLTWYVDLYPDDPGYLRLVLGVGTTGDERMQALAPERLHHLAAVMTREKKTVKIAVTDRLGVQVTAEHPIAAAGVLPDPDRIVEILPVDLRLVHAAMLEYMLRARLDADVEATLAGIEQATEHDT